MFSRAVLIGRGLDLIREIYKRYAALRVRMHLYEARLENGIHAVRREPADVFSGYGGGGTPDPIPNSEVKPSSADGTVGLADGRVRRC